MLIYDTRHALAREDAAKAWPGPVVRYTAHGQTPPDEDGQSVDFIDTSVPVSRLDTLRQILLTGRRYKAARPAGALLVLLGDAADDTARALLKGPNKSVKVAYGLDDTGDLSSLYCAASVVENPNFFTFFYNMAPGLDASHTKPSLALFEQYFGS